MMLPLGVLSDARGNPRIVRRIVKYVYGFMGYFGRSVGISINVAGLLQMGRKASIQLAYGIRAAFIARQSKGDRRRHDMAFSIIVLGASI